MSTSEIPLIDCIASKDGSTWSFYCVHCRHRHTHGAGVGHRVAHCADRSKYPDGYIIRLVSQGAALTASTGNE